MTTLHLHLLGQLRLFWQDQPYPFKALPKVEPLLAYLLLNQATPTQRESLAFRLWPDATEKQAKGRLRRHLYDLRRALPDVPEEQAWLQITAQTVQWNPAASYWLDTAAFEHLSQQSSRLAEATALYTGQLLPDVDESWLLPVRQRLQIVYQQNLNQLIEQSWQTDDYRQALHHCRQLLAQDTLDEEAIRQQLALLYAAGDRGTVVSRYRQFTQELEAELNVEPLPETTAVFTAIQQNQSKEHIFTLAGFSRPQPPTSAPPSPISHNIPTPLRPLIGRQQEQTHIVQLLTSTHPTRLLTLTGTGGIGKTRLAIAVAQTLHKQFAHYFSDGIFFVSLASLRKPEQVIPAIAQTLGLPTSQHTLEAIREQLRYQQVLLILDNFEHVLPATPQLHTLLQTAPQLQLLITSRAPLNLYGEQEYPVPALQLPNVGDANDPIELFQPPASNLENIESVAFFLAIARSTNPRFELNRTNKMAVVQLCQKLDGLPLAIELAAARSKHFPPDVLLQQLTQNLSILQSHAQDVPERHRTIEAALQWSFDLLTPEEQQALLSLSVFEDGFSVPAVASTLLDKPFTKITYIDPEAMALLTSLADKNLIYPAGQNRMKGELRFAMLYLVRSFAAQKLLEADKNTFLEKSLSYYAQWEKTIRQTKGTEKAAEWTLRFQIEYKNLWATLTYLQKLATIPIDLIEAAGRITSCSSLWLASGQQSALQPIFALVLAQANHLPISLRYHINASAGSLATERGDFATAQTYLLAAYDYAQEMGNHTHLLDCLQNLNKHYLNTESNEQALAVIQEAQTLLEQTDKGLENYHRLQQRIASSTGITYFLMDKYNEAEIYLERGLALAKAQNYHQNIGGAAHNIGLLALNMGDFAKADRYLRDALKYFRLAHSNYSVIIAASVLASLAQNLKQYERCVILHSATATWEHRRGIRLPERDEQERQDELALSKEKLGEQTYQVAWRTGRSLTTLEQILALAQQRAT